MAQQTVAGEWKLVKSGKRRKAAGFISSPFACKLGGLNRNAVAGSTVAISYAAFLYHVAQLQV